MIYILGRISSVSLFGLIDNRHDIPFDLSPANAHLPASIACITCFLSLGLASFSLWGAQLSLVHKTEHRTDMLATTPRT